MTCRDMAACWGREALCCRGVALLCCRATLGASQDAATCWQDGQVPQAAPTVCGARLAVRHSVVCAEGVVLDAGKG